MKQNIVFIDVNSVGNFHEIFNTAFLQIMIKNADKLYYIASKSSIDNIKAVNLTEKIQIDNNLVKFLYLPILEGRKSIDIFFRKFFGSIILFILLIKYRKQMIILSSINEFSLIYLNSISRIFNIKIYNICHGELEYVIKKTPKFKPIRVYKFFIVNYFKRKIYKNIKFIVLGESIKNNIVKIYPKNTSHFYSLNHPYFFSDKNEVRAIDNSLLNIGVVGSISVGKGINYFFDLAKIIKDEIDEKKIKMTIIGSHSIIKSQYPHISFVSEPNQYISIKQFNDEVSKLDIVLFFYDKNQYKLTASGAVFDAINHKKTIISFKNDYFLDVLKDSSIGYLCNDIYEMKTIINQILNKQIRINNEADLFIKLQKKYNYDNKEFVTQLNTILSIN